MEGKARVHSGACKKEAKNMHLRAEVYHLEMSLYISASLSTHVRKTIRLKHVFGILAEIGILMRALRQAQQWGNNCRRRACVLHSLPWQWLAPLARLATQGTLSLGQLALASSLRVRVTESRTASGSGSLTGESLPVRLESGHCHSGWHCQCTQAGRPLAHWQWHCQWQWQLA